MNYLTILSKVLFFNDIVSVSKTELDFSLIFFVRSYVASKLEKKEKNERESNDEIKEKLLKSLIDGGIEFKFG